MYTFLGQKYPRKTFARVARARRTRSGELFALRPKTKIWQFEKKSSRGKEVKDRRMRRGRAGENTAEPVHTFRMNSDTSYVTGIISRAWPWRHQTPPGIISDWHRYFSRSKSSIRDRWRRCSMVGCEDKTKGLLLLQVSCF